MNRNTAISEINFPTRVRRAIERANESGKNFKTAGDLMDAKDDDFRGIHFFGTGTIRAMREALNDSGNQNNGGQGGNNRGQTAERGEDGKVLDGRRNNGGQNRGTGQGSNNTSSRSNDDNRGGNHNPQGNNQYTNDNDRSEAGEMQEMELAAQDLGEDGIMGWAKSHANLVGAIIRGEIDLIPSRK